MNCVYAELGYWMWSDSTKLCDFFSMATFAMCNCSYSIRCGKNSSSSLVDWMLKCVLYSFTNSVNDIDLLSSQDTSFPNLWMDDS